MASTFICPKGHTSDDGDFCSECGARIQGSSAPGMSATIDIPPAASGKTCPDCHGPVPPGGVNFCEICGYNFVTQTPGQFPGSVTPVVAAPPPPPIATPPNTNFRLTITVDATLRTPSSPEAPLNAPPIVYPIDKPVTHVGRKSEARAIFPEISLDADTAISHRHGLISQTPDGQLIYRDLSSANGTRLNGADITPLVDTPLKSGDQLTLGHWTRITVEPSA